MHTNEIELKAQARRLAKGLLALNTSVTHSQALDLIGLVHGKRDWKELIGLLRAAAPAQQSVGADKPEASDEDFLLAVEYALRCNGQDEFDLDELVHDVAAPDVASSVNNQGVYDQLECLLGAYGSREALLVKLHEHIRSFDFARPVVRARAWGHNIPAVEFDALPWLLQASDDELRSLLQTSRAGQLGNCDAGDQIVLWCQEQGRNFRRDDRTELKALLERIHHQALAHPDAIGVTVSIDADGLSKFIDVHLAHLPGVVDEFQDLLDAVR